MDPELALEKSRALIDVAKANELKFKRIPVSFRMNAANTGIDVTASTEALTRAVKTNKITKEEKLKQLKLLRSLQGGDTND